MTDRDVLKAIAARLGRAASYYPEYDAIAEKMIGLIDAGAAKAAEMRAGYADPMTPEQRREYGEFSLSVINECMSLVPDTFHRGEELCAVIAKALYKHLERNINAEFIPEIIRTLVLFFK